MSFLPLTRRGLKRDLRNYRRKLLCLLMAGRSLLGGGSKPTGSTTGVTSTLPAPSRSARLSTGNGDSLYLRSLTPVLPQLVEMFSYGMRVMMKHLNTPGSFSFI